MRHLPPSWERTRLGDVFEIVGGSTPKTSVREFWDGDIPWITPDDMSRHLGKMIESGRRFLTQAGYNSTSVRMLPPGSVLYSSRAPIGYTAIASGPVCTNQGFKSLVVPDGVDSSYVYWYMQHVTPDVRDRASGTTFKEISGKRMKEVPFILPPLSEQRRIVAAIEEHLSHLDATKGLLDSASLRLDRLRESVVESALEGEWPIELLSSRTLEQRYGSSAKASEQGDVPVLRMGNIRDGRLDYSSLKYLPHDHPDVSELQLRDGDLLFNRTNSAELVGKSAVFRARSGPMTFASYLIRVRLDETLDPEWASTHINSRKGRRYIDSVVTQQVGQANVNGTKLKNFPVPVPPIEVQRTRMAQLEVERASIDDLEAEIESARTKSEALRPSILAAAFAGRLVHQHPSDEPASVLLDRITAERTATSTSRRREVAS